MKAKSEDTRDTLVKQNEGSSASPGGLFESKQQLTTLLQTIQQPHLNSQTAEKTDEMRKIKEYLKYFIDRSVRVNSENFTQTLVRFKKKIPLFISQQAFEDYLTICKLFDNKRIQIISYNIKAIMESPQESAADFICIVNGSLKNSRLTFSIEINEDKLLRNSALNTKAKAKLASVNSIYFETKGMTAENLIATISAQVSHPLLTHISVSQIPEALSLIRLSVDINKYSLKYGNNPLLLAISKGWCHCNTYLNESLDGFVIDFSKNLRIVIENLLAQSSIDVNCYHLDNGMTPLHIACLRGDDPMLIKLLLDKGANAQLLDFFGKTPSEYLDLAYEDVRKNIIDLTGGDFKTIRALETAKTNTKQQILYTATLPTPEERIINIQTIKIIFREHNVCSLEQHQSDTNPSMRA